MKKLKKGFTLVELVIVIAVIAVLAAVLIPTFSGIIHRSKVSADLQLAKQLNTIAADADTLQEFVDAVDADDNLSVNSLVPQAGGNKFLWVEKADSHSIVYVDGALKPLGDGVQDDALTDAKLWTVVTAANQVIDKAGLNYFLAVDSNQNFVLKNVVNFDTGKNTLKGNLTIENAEQNSTATISGNYTSTITINAPEATINQNGSVAGTLDVAAVANNSLHVNGYVKNLNLTKGKVELANTAYVSTLVLKKDTVKVINDGVVAELGVAADSGITLGSSNEIPATIFDGSEGTVLAAAQGEGEEFKTIQIAGLTNTNFVNHIDDLADLVQFRDAVNGGATFKDVTIQLNANITLEDGWTPIGAFERKKEVNGFQGKFYGNGYTIYNLNNEGYTPGENALMSNKSTIANKQEYTYGLFGYVSNAEISNLNLENVNINIPSTSAAYGDSVAALIGYSYGTLKLSQIRVGEVVNNTSRIEAYDGVGGILGRAYAPSTATAVEITNCSNYAIIAGSEKAGGIAGFVNAATLKMNTVSNYGTVTVDALCLALNDNGTQRKAGFAGGIIAYVQSLNNASQIASGINNAKVKITSSVEGAALNADGIVGSGKVTQTACANNAEVEKTPASQA